MHPSGDQVNRDRYLNLFIFLFEMLFIGLFVLRLVGDKSPGMLVHCALFLLGFNLVLFFDMALLQGVEGL